MRLTQEQQYILSIPHNQWASYQIRKIAGCACAGNAGNVFPRRRFRRKPLFSDPGMHHGTCVTHVPWCMSGSLTCGDGENVPGIPGACAPAILRIWQEAHTMHVDALGDFRSQSINRHGIDPQCRNILPLVSKELTYKYTVFSSVLYRRENSVLVCSNINEMQHDLFIS